MITVDTKTALLDHASDIERLSQSCFQDRVPLAIWRWAYIDNPYGNPVVSLAYDEGNLVAHYAIIPLPVRSIHGRLNSYLSMTTMVAASHRKHGLFVVLAENTYRRAAKLGVDVVMGFPNEMSAPGLKKRLHWELPDSDYVVAVDREQLLAMAPALALADRERYTLAMDELKTREWRLSRPGAHYTWTDGLAYKEFGDSVDLLYYDSPESLRALPDDGRKINVLMSSDIPELLKQRSFPYQFGGISVNKTFHPDVIARHLVLSDVF